MNRSAIPCIKSSTINLVCQSKLRFDDPPLKTLIPDLQSCNTSRIYCTATSAWLSHPVRRRSMGAEAQRGRWE
jgi:hypothetical protein